MQEKRMLALRGKNPSLRDGVHLVINFYQPVAQFLQISSQCRGHSSSPRKSRLRFKNHSKPIRERNGSPRPSDSFAEWLEIIQPERNLSQGTRRNERCRSMLAISERDCGNRLD